LATRRSRRFLEPACGCSAKGGALKSAAFSRTHSRAARSSSSRAPSRLVSCCAHTYVDTKGRCGRPARACLPNWPGLAEAGGAP
jgi:hypothetical protein